MRWCLHVVGMFGGVHVPVSGCGGQDRLGTAIGVARVGHGVEVLPESDSEQAKSGFVRLAPVWQPNM